ncbi:response regulator [Polaribacter gochangensis]|uniref:response regulator n=1 Tax=Polaribacter gochangensis TaxID=3252903 RepID=UPI003904AE79
MKNTSNNLLIVEDNSFIGKKILKATKELNTIVDIRLAESIQEAIAFLNEMKFKFLILDLKLPDGNGIEILKHFKEKKIEKKVFVFSISTELKNICLKYGASAFFDKSKDFDKLIEAIKKA